MNKTTSLGIATAAALFLALGTSPAQAATQRDVIGDAQKICAGPTDGPLREACDLLYKTNGSEQVDPAAGCFDLGNGDNNVVVYLLRNCANNETALLRKASSAVLSLYDYLVKKKADQASVAAGYLCSYHDSYLLLQSAGKLKSSEDLAADAQDILTNLGFTCP